MEKRSFRSIALAFFAFIFAMQNGIAQNDVEMADAMRSNGKIYVVVAVLAIIFMGIIAYLIVIDRKTNKLEKELNELKK